ncbi:hypothetical protein HPB50_002034 [Hyalomma asiaticum]|uniref:Uncharacterized protein n=1 Tax=Hyalomma asiaticum TaxID=266040 RepID=A0ACB7SJV5_HYAAI|nr:hypothetical protein HPB50_002034 [Hyalomma asiaticum]
MPLTARGAAGNALRGRRVETRGLFIGAHVAGSQLSYYKHAHTELFNVGWAWLVGPGFVQQILELDKIVSH